MSEITKKISKISQVMGDGYHFVNMRFLLEDLERDSEDAAVKALFEAIDKVHRLCVYVETK